MVNVTIKRGSASSDMWPLIAAVFSMVMESVLTVRSALHFNSIWQSSCVKVVRLRVSCLEEFYLVIFNVNVIFSFVPL